MNNGIVDVTVHIDEALDSMLRGELADKLRTISGISNTSILDHTPHLMVVQFDPERIGTRQILDAVTSTGVRAELIGL
ncbi:ATP-binding protein [Thioalkalivibrio sp.]|uniref:ATP-binding protein n=1 Tax=Thioalkalivibrio sp. TaxID=2093813 RepID=UPI00356473A5